MGYRPEKGIYWKSDSLGIRLESALSLRALAILTGFSSAIGIYKKALRALYLCAYGLGAIIRPWPISGAYIGLERLLVMKKPWHIGALII